MVAKGLLVRLPYGLVVLRLRGTYLQSLRHRHVRYMIEVGRFHMELVAYRLVAFGLEQVLQPGHVVAGFGAGKSAYVLTICLQRPYLAGVAFGPSYHGAAQTLPTP